MRILRPRVKDRVAKKAVAIFRFGDRLIPRDHEQWHEKKQEPKCEPTIVNQSENKKQGDQTQSKIFRERSRGGKNRLTLTLDAFNLFNVNTVTAYASNNVDSSLFKAAGAIVPPRVLRLGARITF